MWYALVGFILSFIIWFNLWISTFWMLLLLSLLTGRIFARGLGRAATAERLHDVRCEHWSGRRGQRLDSLPADASLRCGRVPSALPDGGGAALFTGPCTGSGPRTVLGVVRSVHAAGHVAGAPRSATGAPLAC